MTSYRMYEFLYKIQADLYGEESDNLIFVLKQLGVSLLGTNQLEQAEETYLKAVKIQEKVQKEEGGEVDEETEREDREKLSQIYFNLYLSAATNMKVDKAKEYNDKNLALNLKIYGKDSTEVSNNHYIRGQLLLKQGEC